MGFLGKYELLEVISDEDARTFNARQVSSGRPVLVHQLAGGPNRANQIDLLKMVLRYLRSASPLSLGQVLDMGEEEGTTYLVTEVLPEFRTLRRWLESEVKKQEPPSTTSSELERLAEYVNAKPSTSASVPARSEGPRRLSASVLFKAPASESPPAPAQADREIGIRDSGLGVRSEGPSVGPNLETRIPNPAFPAAREAAGEFTKLFQAPAAEEASVQGAGQSAELPPSSQEPGEFTRLFRSPLAGGPAVNSPSEPTIEQPQAATRREPGEFTRLFQSPVAGSPSAANSIEPDIAQPPPTSSQGPGDFTLLFRSPAQGDSFPASELKKSSLNLLSSSQPPVSAPRQPSEYTRMFGSPVSSGENLQDFGMEPVPGVSGGSATGVFASPASPEPPLQLPSELKPNSLLSQGPSLPASEPGATIAIPQKTSAQVQPAASTRSSYLPLIIVLSVIFFGALGLILYFALKH